MSEKKIEPFFARFLEGQINVKAGVKAGLGKSTTSTNADNAETMKYPSDSEDNGHGSGVAI